MYAAAYNGQEEIVKRCWWLQALTLAMKGNHGNIIKLIRSYMYK